jgi:hypothetical protein
MLFFLRLVDPFTPISMAQGGLLKNPIGLDYFAGQLFIGDEGVANGSPQAVYYVDVATWSPGADLTNSIETVHAGAPFVEPIGISAGPGILYVADDLGGAVYTVGLPSTVPTISWLGASILVVILFLGSIALLRRRLGLTTS